VSESDVMAVNWNSGKYLLACIQSRRWVVSDSIGSPSTIYFFIPLLPIARLVDVFIRQILLIGVMTDLWRYTFVCNIDWNEKVEVEDIIGANVGMIPRSDWLWKKGQCAYKPIQYMTCGKPVRGYQAYKFLRVDFFIFTIENFRRNITLMLIAISVWRRSACMVSSSLCVRGASIDRR